MSLENLRNEVRMVTRYVYQTWQEHVKGAALVPGVKPLETSLYWRQLYFDCIVLGEMLDMPEIGHFRGSVLATKKIAEDFEIGRAPWDMKPMLLGGPKHRVSRRGKRYLRVPFRHRTPGGTVDAHFREMPKDIYEAAKSLEASLSNLGAQRMIRGSEQRLVGYRRGTKWAGRLTGTEAAYPPKVHEISTNRITGESLARPIRYQHKTGIYEGMVRLEKTYGKATQSHYMTFRTVSDNSDPQSWWHPGWEPHHIAQGISDVLRPRIEKKMEEAAVRDLIALPNLSVGMRVGSV